MNYDDFRHTLLNLLLQAPTITNLQSSDEGILEAVRELVEDNQFLTRLYEDAKDCAMEVARRQEDLDPWRYHWDQTIKLPRRLTHGPDR